MGDGEMDEPESMGAISLAGREHLDNLVFVINCNLQRLDGPVRGNGKIIQELETNFRGAGWNVIKVIWGGRWDPLLEADTEGRLVARMEEVVDGDYQTYKSRDGAFVREHFFGADPELLRMVEHMSDADIWWLDRGGHDPQKVYAAYHEAVSHKGQPTVILAKTIKGYGMGDSRRGPQHHPPAEEDERGVAARLPRPLRPRPHRRGGPRRLLPQARRRLAGDGLPARAPRGARRQPAAAPHRRRRRSTVPGAVGLRDAARGHRRARDLDDDGVRADPVDAAARQEPRPHIVPIVPDESRTFGMEGLFRQLGIFSQVGQLYSPEDAEQLMFYREDEHGQILQEGINEPGAMSSWIAAATSYANHGVAMVPFYVYYSMFGFQRVGDLAWAAGDSRARGFLVGGTAGRTTLNGEGLQHEDGHSHIQASLIPNCVAYDPAYGYELAVIVHDGLRRMLAEQEDVFYYLTIMNENYAQPAMPEGAEEGILRGMHLVRRPPRARRARSSCSARARSCARCSPAPICCAEDYGVQADVWSVTSFTELRRDGMAAERHNRLHPGPRRGAPRSSRSRSAGRGPVVAATDYIRALPDGIRPWVDAPVHGARHGRLRAQRLPQARCAASSRSTATTSRVAALHALGRTTTRARRSSATASTPTRRRRGGGDAGHGPRHRGLRGRPGHRGPRRPRATASRPRTRSSRWSPTRRRWTCPRRSRASSRRCC